MLRFFDIFKKIKTSVKFEKTLEIRRFPKAKFSLGRFFIRKSKVMALNSNCRCVTPPPEYDQVVVKVCRVATQEDGESLASVETLRVAVFINCV